MSTRLKRACILTVALIAVIGLPCLAWWQAEHQAFSLESDVVRRYALEVLHRSDRMVGQSIAGIDTLSASVDPPCAAQTQALMQSIAVNSTYIKVIGHVENGQLVCSSLGNISVSLGERKFKDSNGFTVYSNVPIAKKFAGRIIAIERHGFAALFDSDIWIDIADTMPGMSLAVLHMERDPNEPVSVPTSFVDRKWIQHLHGRAEATFIDKQYLVAVVRSTSSLSAGVAALPLSYIAARRNALAFELVPAGTIAGVSVAVALLLLARRQTTLAGALREGLRNDEFFLQYQPVVDLQSGCWIGAEALLRWRRDNGELIGPDLFIPLAEHTGIITQLTERVFELVECDTRHFLKAYPEFHFALNLSALDIHSNTVIKKVDALLASGFAKPANFIVEITERSNLDVEVASSTIDAVRARGVAVAIDDFGTGYAGLTYLKALKVDFLKIDRSFIEAVGTTAPTNEVVEHIITMASAMGLAMVAEGVENEAQANYLRERGVQSAQGWLFGKAQSLDDIRHALEKKRMSSNAKALS